MKQGILFLFLAFLSLNANSQTKSVKYNYGVVFSMGYFIKYQGSIEVNDSMVFISVINDSGITSTNSYKIITKTNGMVYFSDGVQKFALSIILESGKKKGFEYDTLVSWININLGTSSGLYYSKKE
jgi:hypothetical protein